MLGLNKLEQVNNRRRCKCIRGQNGIAVTITAVATVLAFILLIYFAFHTSPPAPTQQRPFDAVVSDAKQFYDGLQHIISLRVDGQGEKEQKELLEFQKEQKKIVEEKRKALSSNQLGEVLNSIYTPEPVYVPEVSYLLQLPGSCHPAHAQQQGAESSSTVCQKCDTALIKLFPTLLDESRCKTSPMVSIYHCDGSESEQDTKSVPIVIPCQSAFVDGASQFWALYSIATIFGIASAILVRRRLEKSRQKVLHKLIKPK